MTGAASLSLSPTSVPLPLIPGVFLNRSSLALTFLHLWVAAPRRLIYPIFMRKWVFVVPYLYIAWPGVMFCWRPRDFPPSKIVEVELD